MGEHAAPGLIGIDGDGELVGGRDIGHGGLELAWRVEPLRGQAEVEALGGRSERRLAVDREPRCHADHRLAERQLLHVELLDTHFERQFRQDSARA